ncbi:MAG: hypothetical protein IPN59_09380 [Holophaga sp.]|nr:hypothetical protein [Holophaga sp.]
MGLRPMAQAGWLHFTTRGETPDENAYGEVGGEGRPWANPNRYRETQTYSTLLEESLSRLDQMNPDHRASLDLILTEMDRLPDDENLWLHLASRLGNWNLDDELGPRFERALKKFQGPGIWDKAARCACRRNQHQEERTLGWQTVADRFRATTLSRR